MMWIVCEMLADLLLPVFVMKNVNADQQETRRVNTKPIGDKDKTFFKIDVECRIFNEHSHSLPHS